MDKTLHIVHCIDTEGPLYESLDSTFERLNSILHLNLQPSKETLILLQNGKMLLDGKEKVAQTLVDPALLTYNDDWGKIDTMLDKIMNAKFRHNFNSSDNSGWKFSWFVMDHIGYDVNPRRRDIGYHNIYDHYKIKIKELDSNTDEIHWHFHPSTTYNEAHKCATSFQYSPHLLEGLCRRIIDRNWFPSCFRAGFHTERPDSHWFLEQWIPFDFSNQSKIETDLEKSQNDITNGRFGDWRRAPSDWSHYHPSHDDYQVPGNCRRTIFRCLNVGTRLRLLEYCDVEAAFARVESGEDTILAFCDHDWRDMQPDIEHAYEMIEAASVKYPTVKWKFSGAKDAAQTVLGIKNENSIEICATLEKNDKYYRLTVSANDDIFGVQPFLAVKTLSQQYLSDNFDFTLSKRQWHYTFDEHTILPESIEKIGIAVNGRNGSTCVLNMDKQGEIVSKNQIK